MRHAHIIGAGVAGLSTAVHLLNRGWNVTLHESAGHAGGRCRSFVDATLGCRIDNGNHLLLSGNGAALEYLSLIDAADGLTGPDKAAFPFLDLKTGRRWTVEMGAGRLPWWIFSEARRVPGSRPADYVRALRLAWAGERATVAECLGADNPLFKRFWEPLAVAVLNTAADEGAASLLWPVIRETFGRGEAACRPLIARVGLSESFIDPALRFLAGRRAGFFANHRLRALSLEGDRVAALTFEGGDEAVAAGDAVVLAVPPRNAAELVPGLIVPDLSRAIVNGHFRLPAASGDFSFLGLVGGVAQWLFVRGAVASVTVSAADTLADDDAAAIAGRLWDEVRRALALGEAPLPAYRIVKEKRATFAQTPDQVRRRPPARTPWKNLFLAGDWTQTGLPATIEGAIRSGRKAAETVIWSGSRA
ncbi:MAG: FAD-dependent oxidoreductase [Rhodospirillales bacterium]|nr:FAD-dependent oxidoreductase [Rhodospirillales bacterium]